MKSILAGAKDVKHALNLIILGLTLKDLQAKKQPFFVCKRYEKDEESQDDGDDEDGESFITINHCKLSLLTSRILAGLFENGFKRFLSLNQFFLFLHFSLFCFLPVSHQVKV